MLQTQPLASQYRWAVSYYFNNPGILVFAVIFAIVMNITSYWFSDKIVTTINGAHEAPESEYPDLHHIVENLAITAGLPKPRDIYC
jgi:Zn-dependent protease with chaperone function